MIFPFAEVLNVVADAQGVPEALQGQISTVNALFSPSGLSARSTRTCSVNLPASTVFDHRIPCAGKKIAALLMIGVGHTGTKDPHTARQLTPLS
jgi:hypothetical protein